MKELIITLLFIVVSAYVSYYFTSDIYFRKGLMAAQEKCKAIQIGGVVGYEALLDRKERLSDHPVMGYIAETQTSKSVADYVLDKIEGANSKTGHEATVLRNIYEASAKGKFSINIIGLKVKLKNGDIVAITGISNGDLMAKYKNGNCGTIHLENIVEIIKKIELENAK